MNQIWKSVALAVCAAGLTAAVAAAADLPNLDRSMQPPALGSLAATRAVAGGFDRARIAALQKHGVGRTRRGLASHFDSELGVHTFLWSGPDDRRVARYLPLKAGDQRTERVAREFLGRNAAALGLSKQSISDAVLFERSLKRSGPGVARFQQRHRGVPVFGRQLNVMLDRSGAPVAVSGYFAPTPDSAGRASALDKGFSLLPEAAGERAFADLQRSLGSTLPRVSGKVAAPGSSPVKARMSYKLLKQPRVQRVYFPLGKNLVPAYYAEVEAGHAGLGDLHNYAYVISAGDGSLLFRKNLTAHDAYAYRVFADTDGINLPADGPLGSNLNPIPNPANPAALYPREPALADLVTLDHGPISTDDAWLAPGATETVGNNIDAYLDLAAPDGLVPGGADRRAGVSAPGSFDHAYVGDALPITEAQRSAAAVNLFYVTNFLHDWWYDNGFTESAGNAQQDNYGRGGLGGDSIRAEAQDFSGLNNANMTTPADGARPRMQMYLWTGRPLFTVNAPAALAGNRSSSSAVFGPPIFELSGDMVGMLDAANAAGPETTDGCSAATNAAQIAGHIALMSEGGCPFSTKTRNAQAAGATGAVISAAAGTTLPPSLVLSEGEGSTAAITIPTLGITFADGGILRAAMATAAVKVRMLRRSFDGAMDNSLVAHEWFHYVSNRLVGNAGGLGNPQGLALGEGWSDFSALMLSVREDDRLVPGNEDFGGAYSIGAYVASSPYFGIRRAPYSTDFGIFPLSFRHIADENAYDGPVPFKQASSNSEVHNTGEVWANTLWEIYAALLRDPRYSFTQAQERMKDYVIAGLKMTPNTPTFTEARDALLAVALATDDLDFDLMAKAFARRGLGLFAQSPDRFSSDNHGVVESFALVPAFEVTDLALDMSYRDGDLGYCDDDDILDVGETGLLRLKIRNYGTASLSGAIAKVASAADVSFGNGGVLTFPDAAPGEEVETSIPVTLNSAATAQAVEFRFSFPQHGETAESSVEPGDQVFTVRVDLDLEAFERSSDDLSEPTASLKDWAVTGTTGLSAWQIADGTAALGSGSAWLGPDNGAAGDIYLATPALSLSRTQETVLEFDQAYEFENGYDGGRIEVTTDGSTWTEATAAGGKLSVPYGQKPLIFPAGAYTGTRATRQHVTVRFAAGALSGEEVRFRFHVASDSTVGAMGWWLDNLRIGGTTVPPFSAVTGDFHGCAPRIADFSVDAIEVGESVGEEVSVEVLLSAPSDKPITIPLSVSGTASGDGVDYTILGEHQISIPAGEVMGNLDLRIQDDELDEDRETIVLTMGEPVNAVAGTTRVATVHIDDDDLAPTVRFSAATQSVRENAGSASATLQLSAPSSFDVTVPVLINLASTASTNDYALPQPLEITIPAGTSSANLEVALLDDQLDEPDESVVLQLGTPVHASITAPFTHTLSIDDDDGLPTLAFAQEASRHDETAGTVMVMVTLSEPSAQKVSVPFTVLGSAGSSDRRIVSSSPLEIPAGASGVSIVVALIDDSADESDETVALTLGTPANATLGSRRSHLLTIEDNEDPPPGNVELSAASYSVNEGGASVTLTLIRSGGKAGVASVKLITADGDAKAGSDYTARSQTVTWADGDDQPKLVKVTVNNDALVEGAESFRVSLSSASVAKLGRQSSATVNILDNDVPPPSDKTPDTFIFTDVKGVALSTQQTSNAVTIRGINVPAPITVTGGTYSINGGSYTRNSGTVRNGDTVRARHVSSGNFNTVVNTLVRIGGAYNTFTTTTRSADTTPDGFEFDDRRGVKGRTDVYSNTVTISGLGSGVRASVRISNNSSGGEASYSINGASFRTSSSTVHNGDKLRLRNRVPSSSGSVRATLSVGGRSESWTISTSR